MISLLSGTIAGKAKQTVVVLTAGGVGYDVVVSPVKAMEAVVGAPISLYTYLKVSDSALELFGFATMEERSFFSLLTTVSGIGPKTAMNIMTLGSIDAIQSAIARGDVKYLTAVNGLGKKTAERLVVELKQKVGGSSQGSVGESGILGEVIDGLVALGYSESEARDVVQTLDTSGKTTEDVLRIALKHMR
ncbi:MAG TPA: Holliday junction branch migration protein RuvA [Candidatus Kapabacteria bacterium]|nr:Holliday junction branch migration protein RuvA [Candidatus Kapabacteria bacterium]